LRPRSNVLTSWQFLIVEHRELNPFADAKLDHRMKLAFARDIQRLWTSLLAEPIPPHLQVFVDRLRRALEERR
jgi:hypothetical protein